MILVWRGVKYLLLAVMFVLLGTVSAVAFAVIGVVPALLLIHLVNLSLSVLGQDALSNSQARIVGAVAVVLAALFGVYVAQRTGRVDLRRSRDPDLNRLGALLDVLAAPFSFRR
jgi:uncharacterized membrane protein YfcA